MFLAPILLILSVTPVVVFAPAAINLNEPVTTSNPTAGSQLRYSAILHGAFPISIAPLGLNWGDDQFLKLAVTFKYEYWTQGNVSSGPAIKRQEANADGSAVVK